MREAAARWIAASSKRRIISLSWLIRTFTSCHSLFFMDIPTGPRHAGYFGSAMGWWHHQWWWDFFRVL